MGAGRYYAVAQALVGLVGVGCGFEIHATPDDGPIDTAPPDMPPAPPPTSCNALHTSQPTKPSGPYEIDPDGDGPDAPLTVTCDMTAAGGGWTIVFVAASQNLTSAPTYTSSTPRLLTDADQALIAYRDANSVALSGSAVFNLPPQWKSGSPFTQTSADLPTTVSVDGAAATSSVVRFGSATFANSCSDPWLTGSYGRLCITGTTAPFYSGFTDPALDTCSTSQAAWNAQACSGSRKFTIAVR